VKVAAGTYHTYALLADGTVRAWGSNDYGQLGNGTITASSKPVVVGGLSAVTTVAGGSDFGCALVGGQARCWGNNDYGQLGNGTTTDSLTPVTVSGAGGYQKLDLGAVHACAVNGTTPYCWGYNQQGALGITGVLQSTTPVVGTAFGAVDILIARNLSTAIIRGNVVIRNASGDTSLDSLANGRFLTSISLPMGSITYCATEAAQGAVWCSGANESGQLGNGTTTQSATPVNTGLTGAVFVQSGYSTVCALKSDGSVWCWGSNAGGMVGDGSTTTRTVPTQVKGLNSGVVSLSVGITHACAVKADGTVWCWGSNNSGQLGDGTTFSRGVPTQVLL